ncbi:MAG: LamG-like jellyroll fold domain-containing protein [bacterium]|nr:LamG-like jellyroll fold domain-containing protein [bacterium]
MKTKFYILILFAVIIFTGKSSNAQMFWNQAGSFAGVSTSYIAVPSSASLDITGSFTLEAWIMPNDINTPSIPIIVGKGTSPRYDLRLSSTIAAGRVAVRTNGITRLTSKTSVTSGNWSHVAATYNSGSGLFSIYINGSLDTSATVAGAVPTANADSLLIGKGLNSPFLGLIDEVRVWNTNLSSTEVSRYRRTSLGTSSGIYAGLVMSISFQDDDALGSDFSLTDWSENSNNGFNRGVTAVDLSNRPLQTISINECVELNGSDEYMAAADAPVFSPSDQLTLQAWIYPRSFDKTNVIIQKGSTDGKISDFALRLTDGMPGASINNINTFTTDDVVPLNQWSHVAFVFDGPTGIYSFYINGKLVEVGTNDKGFIIDGTDSLYIGGTPDLADFDGFLDEVRVWIHAASQDEINEFLFQSVDESNAGVNLHAAYNFDGGLLSNSFGNNRLYFRNGASFSHSGVINNQPVSPLNRADNLNFQKGYYIKSSDRRIPATGSNGLMTEDTLSVSLNEVITDLNVFIAVNHEAEQNLSVTLTGPNGDVVNMLPSGNTLVTNSDNMVTILNDEADSSIVSGRYVSFAPVIKPGNNLNSVFTGDNSSGKWKLAINDVTVNDTGRLYAWGIQFNNRTSKPTNLSTASIIQGFYSASTNSMVRDTMRYILHYTFPPYAAVDTGKVYLNTNGTGTAEFDNAQTGVLYYIELKHRNSIETWSTNAITFDALTDQAEYKFDTDITSALGDNMIQVDATPVKFAIYGGDVDKDGTVDVTDITIVYNDANNFVSGYVNSDVTGDNFTDVSDLILTFNNSVNFVSAVVP